MRLSSYELYRARLEMLLDYPTQLREVVAAAIELALGLDKKMVVDNGHDLSTIPHDLHLKSAYVTVIWYAIRSAEKHFPGLWKEHIRPLINVDDELKGKIL